MIIDWSNRDKDGLFNYLNDVQWSTGHGNSSRIKQLQVQKNSYQKDHVDKITNHNG